jgi:hypothetical protein
MSRNLISRFRASLLASAMTAATLALTPVIDGALAPAQAQVTISAEFRTALEPHGRFQRHSRYGEVWIPANRTRDWRPYTVGRWVYTEEWGWYWIEDQPEAAWGVVAFHYGRWVYDDELRWVWVASNEWGPGWVQWRQGRGERRDYIGWAPMAPDDVVVAEYQEKPEVWVFVRGRNFTAPRISAVVVPQREATVILRETVIVNRTVVVRDRFAVNPGIAPAIIAAAVGRPIRAYEVRPRVLAGTVQLPNAVVIRPDELRRNPRAAARIEVRETRTEIRASAQVADPQPLGANERGRLGDTPPRAAQTGTGQTPATGAGQTPAAGTSPTTPSAGQQPGQDAAKQQQGQDAAKQQQGQDAAKQQQGQDATKQQGQDAAKQQSPSQQKQDSARDAGQQKQDAAKQKQDAAKQKQDAAKQKQDAAQKQRDDARGAAKQKQDDAREAAKQKSDAAKQKQDAARDAAKQKQPSGPSDAAKQKQDPKANEPRTGQGPQPKQEGKGTEGEQKQSAPSQPQNRTEGRGEGQNKGQGAPKAKQEEPKAKQDQPQAKPDEAPPTRPGAPQ